jgi:hypothetical protein
VHIVRALIVVAAVVVALAAFTGVLVCSASGHAPSMPTRTLVKAYVHCERCGHVSVPVLLPSGITARDLALDSSKLADVNAYGQVAHDVREHLDRIGAL